MASQKRKKIFKILIKRQNTKWPLWFVCDLSVGYSWIGSMMLTMTMLRSGRNMGTSGRWLGHCIIGSYLMEWSCYYRKTRAGSFLLPGFLSCHVFPSTCMPTIMITHTVNPLSQPSHTMLFYLQCCQLNNLFLCKFPELSILL